MRGRLEAIIFLLGIDTDSGTDVGIGSGDGTGSDDAGIGFFMDISLNWRYAKTMARRIETVRMI